MIVEGTPGFITGWLCVVKGIHNHAIHGSVAVELRCIAAAKN
jgi:hypothetical protein